MGGICLLFNPIIPVYLSKQIWIPFDLGASVFIIAFGIYFFRFSSDE
jgi:hypothetical protein